VLRGEAARAEIGERLLRPLPVVFVDIEHQRRDRRVATVRSDFVEAEPRLLSELLMDAGELGNAESVAQSRSGTIPLPKRPLGLPRYRPWVFGFSLGL
jgi:hypothetical protein